MQLYDVEVTFKTEEPLSQADGERMWSLAAYFGTRAARTYQVSTTFEADSPLDATDGLAGQMRALLHPRSMELVAVSAALSAELPEPAAVSG